MRDPSPSPRSPYRRPNSGGGGDAPRHRRGTHSGVHAIAARRWPRRTLIAANALVALTIVGAASAYGYVNWRFSQIHTKVLPALSTKVGGGNPFTLLVVGSDSRAALSSTPGNSQFGGTAAVAGQRSDTIILIRVVPKSRQLMMLSIPRDLWGPIPGHDPNRINVAFDTGANLLIQTVEQDLGIPINHYVEINFDTFRDISNAVGGVNFYFPTPARDTYSNLSVPAAGCYSLKGDQALAFVRSRHYQYFQNGSWNFEGLSDLARIQRQQAFIKKMIKQAEGEFTNPIALNNIIGGITKNLTVDSGFSTGLMLSLAADFRSMNVSGIPNVTLPTYSYVTGGGADVLGLQQPQAASVIAAFNAFGKVAPTPAAKHAASHPANTLPPATVPPANVSIEVANGTGTSGQAGQMKTVLTGLGYHVGVVASPGYGHSTTEIRYSPSSRTAAQQVAAQVSGGAILVAAPDLAGTAYNLEVITGSSFAGSSSSTASSASTSPTTGAPPSTTTSVYHLPGTASGQITPTC